LQKNIKNITLQLIK